jgi:hypothetical protein
MKNYTENQLELVLNYLKGNSHKTITGGEIKDLFQLTTIQLQGLIHQLRVMGQPIVSKGKLGYQYTTDKDELLKCYTSLMGRGTSIIQAANGLFNYIDERGEYV